MNKSPMIYGVIIFRTDQQHIVAIEDSNYDKCVDLWNKMQEEWKIASKEQRPFILTDPIVTAFTPSMIYEIKLIPLTTQDMQSKSHNPYQNRMVEQGLSRTFPGSGIDLLSRSGDF